MQLVVAILVVGNKDSIYTDYDIKIISTLADLSWDIAERKLVDNEITQYQQQLRSLASELSRVEEKERREIATDIHDRIGHTLAISKMKLEELELSMSLKQSIHLNLLKETSELIDQTIQDTRNLIYEISPTILYELGFEAAVDWLADNTQEKYNLMTDVNDDGHHKPLDTEVAIVLFKAVREILVNILKHAQTNRAFININQDKNNIRVEINDKGIGFDFRQTRSESSKKCGFGLFNIKERLDQLGGEFIINSKPGKGTKVVLIAPLTIE